MKNKLSLTIILAIVALIALLSLQYLWITQSYKQENERIRLTTLQLMKKEIYVEVNNSSYEYKFEPGIFIYQGGNIENKTVFVVTEKNGEEIDRITRHCKTIEEWYEYIQYMYASYHHNGINLQRLDSSFTAALSANKIKLNHKMELVERASKTIKDSTYTGDYGDYKLIIDTIPLGIDNKDALVVKFDNSFTGMFSKLKNIIYVSAAIVIVLLFILLFLARTISFQISLSKAREEYVGFMVHEIRNPVSYLANIFELNGSKINIEKYLPTAKKNIGQLRLMLEKLQVVSMGRELYIKLEETNIGDELETIASTYADNKTFITIEAASDRKKINVDKLHFYNAVGNLVENASKYRRGDCANIMIRYWEDNGRFNLSVEDDGIGITKIDLLGVFEKGYRVPESKRSRKPGFGLGLAYIRMVAMAHGGDVTAISKYKDGSTFTITIKDYQI